MEHLILRQALTTFKLPNRLSPDEYLSTRKPSEIVSQRHIVAYVLSQYLGLKEVGKLLNRHYTTVINSKRAWRNNYFCYPKLAEAAIEYFKPQIEAMYRREIAHETDSPLDCWLKNGTQPSFTVKYSKPNTIVRPAKINPIFHTFCKA